MGNMCNKDTMQICKRCFSPICSKGKMSHVLLVIISGLRMEKQFIGAIKNLIAFNIKTNNLRYYLKKSKLRRHSHTLLIKKEFFTRLCPPLFHVYSIYIWSGVSKEFRFQIKAWFPQKCGFFDICFFHILKYLWYPGSALMSKDLHCQINHKDNIAGINAENAAN